jgi:hypothetical protein
MTDEELDAIEAKYRCDAGHDCEFRAEHERNEETLRLVAEVRRLWAARGYERQSLSRRSMTYWREGSAMRSEQAENSTYRVVTPEELRLGYVTYGKWSDPSATIMHHTYRVIRELPDGNFVVEEPRVERRG